MGYCGNLQSGISMNVIEYIQTEFKSITRYKDSCFILKNNVYVKFYKNYLDMGIYKRGNKYPIIIDYIGDSVFYIRDDGKNTLYHPLDQFEYLRKHKATSEDAIIFLHDMEYLLRKKDFDLKFDPLFPENIITRSGQKKDDV